ncbi:hypothetical protein COOONC_18291 [Cooperia oncophora]
MAAFPQIVAKLKEIPARICLSKFEDDELHILLENGEVALAALSMDGINLDGHKLSVRLRSPDWTDSLQPKLTKFASSLTSSDTVSIQECDLTITNGVDFELDVATSTNTFDAHCEHIARKANSMVYGLFKATKNSIVLLRAFRTYIRPVLYGTPIFNPYKAKMISLLEKSPKSLHEEVDDKSFRLSCEGIPSSMERNENFNMLTLEVLEGKCGLDANQLCGLRPSVTRVALSNIYILPALGIISDGTSLRLGLVLITSS